ncbi:MAG: pyridoxal phosphate-dependent aminotransferase [Deltaproteobacteria bacterium]|nr:pyridoxal phosphate-dependent aminotransferase [Deltaproteobacteria bacterium]
MRFEFAADTLRDLDHGKNSFTLNPFARIEYLEWAKAQYARVKFDAASNGRPAMSLAGLGEVSRLLGELGSYQAALEREAEAAVAGWVGCAASDVAMTPGTSGALFAVAAALGGRGVRVAVERPTYEPLWRAFQAVGAAVRFFKRPSANAFQPDLASLKTALTRGARVVVLSNLHNPSGVALDRGVYKDVVALASRHGARVVVDEVFGDLVPRPVRAHVFSREAVSVASLTKAYGLGALRFGWVAAPPRIAARVREVVSYTMGTHAFPSLRLGIAALARIQVLHREAVGETTRARGSLVAWAKRAGLNLSPTSAYFGLVDVGRRFDDRAFIDALIRKRATISAPGSFFGAPGCLRVSAVSPSAPKALARLAAALGERVEAEAHS